MALASIKFRHHLPLSLESYILRVIPKLLVSWTLLLLMASTLYVPCHQLLSKSLWEYSWSILQVHRLFDFCSDKSRVSLLAAELRRCSCMLEHKFYCFRNHYKLEKIFYKTLCQKFASWGNACYARYAFANKSLGRSPTSIVKDFQLVFGQRLGILHLLKHLLQSSKASSAKSWCLEF